MRIIIYYSRTYKTLIFYKLKGKLTKSSIAQIARRLRAGCVSKKHDSQRPTIEAIDRGQYFADVVFII